VLGSASTLLPASPLPFFPNSLRRNLMSVVTQDILDIVQNQQRWRRQECINLIASENVQSPAVQQIEGNDFMCRYARGIPTL